MVWSFLLVLPDAAVRAQSPAPRPDSVRLAPARAASRAVTVRGEPGSFQVVSVPMPAEFLNDATATYTIDRASSLALLGRRAGVPGGTSRAVLLTIGVPANAKAGPMLVARVLFHGRATAVEVPVLIDVPPVRKVTLQTPELVTGAISGGRVNLDLNLVNSGNSFDTLRVGLILPSGWRQPRAGLEAAPLSAGATHKRQIRIDVPDRTSTGDHYLRIRVTGSDSARTEKLVRIEIGQGNAMTAPPGPSLTTSVGSVTVDGGAPVSVVQLLANGQLTGTVGIDARAGLLPGVSSAELRALARVGTYLTTPQLSLWTADWRLVAGNTPAAIGDLTGNNAGGQGVSFNYQTAARELNAVAARPLNGGQLIGGRVAQPALGGMVSLSAASFTSQQTAQQLRAAALGGRWSVNRIGTLSTDIAYRSSPLESGIGSAASFEHTSERGSINARALHAPGGSSAFARAADELFLAADRELTERFSLSISGFGASDRSTTSSSIRARSWSATPNFQLSKATHLRVQAQQSSYMTQGRDAFGSEETRVAASVSSVRWGIAYSAEGSLSQLERTLTVGGVDLGTSAPHYGMRANAAHSNQLGRFLFEGSYEWGSGADVVAPEQLALQARAERIRFAGLPSNLFLEAEIGHQRFGRERSFNLMRAGLSYTLPNQMELHAALERNSIFSTARTSAPIMFSLRIDKAITLPRLRAGATMGHVYQDLNGNGRRDPGELGVGQVSARQGGIRVTTDPTGSFVFWERSRGAITLDEGSLPFGWLVGQSQGDPREIPLVPTSNVSVVLELGAAERLRAVDLTAAVITAQDDAGRIFNSRRTASDSAVFDALPVGHYTLSFDFSGMAEPLRAQSDNHSFTVAHGSIQTVRVPVAGRPLRFKKNGLEE